MFDLSEHMWSIIVVVVAGSTTASEVVAADNLECVTLPEGGIMWGCLRGLAVGAWYRAIWTDDISEGYES